MPFKLRLLLLSFLISTSLIAGGPSEEKLRVLYNSLDPLSVAQHLAFYELYSDKSIGQKALKEAWQLMAGRSISLTKPLHDLPSSPEVIQSVVALVNKPTDQEISILSETDLRTIESLASCLPHQRLRGHQAITEEEVIVLPAHEIDLARGLFLSQFGTDLLKIRSYEALIDLMALQILARLCPKATPATKIETINRFIFEEMGFRFPPHSLYAKEIDVYTFLPSVLDSRRGVCLGVSILYLCLAQRLDLTLEMITPPGHIYIRYRDLHTTINIETTARGVHIDSDEYLSLETRSLQERTIKEVIGLAHFNQASVYWQKKEYLKALEAYQKAAPYLSQDPLLKEILAYTYIVAGNVEEGKKRLIEVKDHVADYAIVKETVAEDYLQGAVDAEGLKVLFVHVDEKRQSVLDKKQALEAILQRCPYFRAGQFQLAVAWLQLHRAGEALSVLETYHRMHPNDPEANYYMSVLYAQRQDYPKAWRHLKIAENLVKSRNYDPKVLRDLRRQLVELCPD